MKTSKWDMAEFIESKEDVIAHLTVALEENDIDFLLSVLNALARSKGMAQIAADLGVSRERLYKTFSRGSNPAFGTKNKQNMPFGIYVFSVFFAKYTFWHICKLFFCNKI